MNHRLKKVITPKGEVRYELRVWGRKHGTLKRRFEDKFEAQQFLKTLLEEPEDDNTAVDSHNGIPRFQTEFDFWYATRAKSFAPGWKKNIDQYWLELKEELALKPVDQITKSTLKLIESKLLEKGNSQKTVNEKVGIVLTVLNYSLRMDRIAAKDHNLLNYTKTKTAKTMPSFWNKSQVEQFLKHTSAHYATPSERWVYCVYLIALNTGLRAGEIWGLQWEDFRPSDGLIIIKGQLDLVTREYRITKGRAERAVPLNDAVWQEILKLKAGRAKSGYVFTDQKGQPISHRAFSKRFDRDVKNSGCQKISFHDLRHTSATLMLTSGIDVRTVQEVLGHKDLQTTMRYLHALKEGVRGVAKSFILTSA